MSDGDVVTFDAARRSSPRGGGPRTITDRWLRRRQATIPLSQCHAAFERMSYEIRTKTRRFTLFHEMSVGFPKGRRITLLGHKGSGKTALFELLLKERPPTQGRVHVTSRLSWPIHLVKYLDPRLSVRQNVVFVSHVLGVDPGRLLAAMERFCQLDRRRTHEPLSAIPMPVKRRLGILIVMAADFDCLLIDHPMRGKMFGLDGKAAAEFEETILSRDYIASVTNPRNIPSNCDLAYLLYDGRLYMYEDIDEAVSVFKALPEPYVPGGIEQKADTEDEDDAEYREEGF